MVNFQYFLYLMGGFVDTAIAGKTPAVQMV